MLRRLYRPEEQAVDARVREGYWDVAHQKYDDHCDAHNCQLVFGLLARRQPSRRSVCIHSYDAVSVRVQTGRRGRRVVRSDRFGVLVGFERLVRAGRLQLAADALLALHQSDADEQCVEAQDDEKRAEREENQTRDREGRVVRRPAELRVAFGAVRLDLNNEHRLNIHHSAEEHEAGEQRSQPPLCAPLLYVPDAAHTEIAFDREAHR